MMMKKKIWKNNLRATISVAFFIENFCRLENPLAKNIIRNKLFDFKSKKSVKNVFA